MAEANELFIQILSRGPSPGTILVVLEKMKVEGRVKEVIQTCLRALTHYPDDIRLRRLLAESYLDAGFIGPAETELGKVVEHLDDWIPVYKTQAGLFARQGRSEEALQALHRYLAHRPHDREALHLLERLQLGVEPQPAVPSAKEATASRQGPAPLSEEDEEVLSDLASPTLAEIYYNQGQIEEAISTYEKVVANNAGDTVSVARLEELRSSLTGEEASGRPGETAGPRRERMISILESWLTRVQELNRAG